MSGIVEQAEQAQENQAKNDYLVQLIEGEEITGKAAGITKLVIDQGEDVLSDKQRYVFNKEVEEPFLDPRCERCESSLPWNEAYYALHGSRLCSSCQHDHDKFFQET